MGYLPESFLKFHSTIHFLTEEISVQVEKLIQDCNTEKDEILRKRNTYRVERPIKLTLPRIWLHSCV